MLNQIITFAHAADVPDKVDESFGEHMMDRNHWFGDGGFSVLWMIVIMVLSTILIVYLVKIFVDSRSTQDPLEIAKIRLAKGEIDKKEFEKIKKDLS